MTSIRAFIAIKLPTSIQEQLEKISRDLQTRMQVSALRWVPIHNIHLTLKFLGDVSPANLKFLNAMLVQEASRHPDLDISVGGLGSFPSLRRPRVVWIGLQAPPELAALQKGIDAGSARLGFASEEREFSPHLTLARVAQNTSPGDTLHIGEVLAHYHVDRLGTFKAGEIWLFKSDLQPGGPIYTPLFHTQLGTGNHATESI